MRKRQAQARFLECGTKVRYRSKDQAVRALHLIVSHAAPTRVLPVRVYLCDQCNGWHLTSKAS